VFSRYSIFGLPVALMLMGASACQSSTPQAENPTPPVTPAAPAPLTPCGSGAPHLDRDKIKQLLLEQGVLTPEMTQEQQQQILSDYIRKRQQAYSKCKKEPKA